MLVVTNWYADKENNSKAAQSSNGTAATQPDVSPMELQQLCKEYKKDLTVSTQEAQHIEDRGDEATEWRPLRPMDATS